MKRIILHRRTDAFTLIELLVIVFTVVMLLLLLLSGAPLTRREVLRRECANNLKQVGLAFRLWAPGSGDGYPMARSTNNYGTLEFIGTGESFRHFQVMSNELTTPNVLVCPSDVRRRAKDFVSGFSNANVSYFVGVDADETQPQMLLSGDRNITNGISPTNGMLILTTNNPVRWTEAMHKFQGNIVLADGSVQRVDIPSLQNLIEHTGVATNRINLP